MSRHDEIVSAVESVPRDDGVIVVEWLGWEAGTRLLADRAPAHPVIEHHAAMIVLSGPTPEDVRELNSRLSAGDVPEGLSGPPGLNTDNPRGAQRDGGW
jgi:hypothetical protein